MIHYTEDNVPTHLNIAHLIHLLNQHKDRLLEKHLQPFNISGAQYRVLRLVVGEIANTPSALSQALSIDAGAMTRMLDKLEQRNLLCRERNPEDRRQIRVQPTEEGIALYQKIRTIAADLLNELTGDLESDELSELERLMRKILDVPGLLQESCCGTLANAGKQAETDRESK